MDKLLCARICHEVNRELTLFAGEVKLKDAVFRVIVRASCAGCES